MEVCSVLKVLTAWRESTRNNFCNFQTAFPLFNKYKSSLPFAMCTNCVSIYHCPLLSEAVLSLKALLMGRPNMLLQTVL